MTKRKRFFCFLVFLLIFSQTTSNIIETCRLYCEFQRHDESLENVTGLINEWKIVVSICVCMKIVWKFISFPFLFWQTEFYWKLYRLPRCRYSLRIFSESFSSLLFSMFNLNTQPCRCSFSYCVYIKVREPIVYNLVVPLRIRILSNIYIYPSTSVQDAQYSTWGGGGGGNCK